MNPATPLHYLDYVMDKVDQILLMSVNPGFGGQSFIEGTLEKVRQVRQRIITSGRDIRLEVDQGGMKPVISGRDCRSRCAEVFWQGGQLLTR